MLWKKATLFGLAGFAVGAVIGACISLAEAMPFREALPHLLLGGIYGAAAMAGSVVYDIEKWSISRATVTHFLLVFALYFLLAVSMGWFSLADPVFWLVVGAMAVAYALIWLLQYLSCRRRVRAMNDALQEWKTRGKGAPTA